MVKSIKMINTVVHTKETYNGCREKNSTDRFGTRYQNS